MEILFKYMVVGVFGALTHFLVLFFLVEITFTPPLIASCVGFLITVLISYFPNYYWTFGAAGNHKNVLTKYIVVSTSGFFSNFLFFSIGFYLFSLHYALSQLMAAVAVPITNFILNKKWTFTN